MKFLAAALALLRAASAAGSAADLLNDLKSGYLLGANPRRQFLAQFAGIFSGTAATVMGFYLLVPDATALNGAEGVAPKFPAPAAQAWKAVAEVFKTGLANMHPMHQQAIVVGLILGVVILLLETFLPKARKFLPSATGLGLGLILPFQYPFAMLIGASIAYFWNRKNAKQADDYLVPLSAGVIAGVSIMGVLVAVINNLVFALGVGLGRGDSPRNAPLPEAGRDSLPSRAGTLGRPPRPGLDYRPRACALGPKAAGIPMGLSALGPRFPHSLTGRPAPDSPPSDQPAFRPGSTAAQPRPAAPPPPARPQSRGRRGARLPR
jgi:hypothetical protein